MVQSEGTKVKDLPSLVVVKGLNPTELSFNPQLCLFNELARALNNLYNRVSPLILVDKV